MSNSKFCPTMIYAFLVSYPNHSIHREAHSPSIFNLSSTLSPGPPDFNRRLREITAIARMDPRKDPYNCVRPATQGKQSEEGMGFSRTARIIEQDKLMLRFVKRSRTTPESGSGCSSRIQMEPEPFSFINIGYNQEHTSWSLNAERLPGRTDSEKEIQWDNNLEERLAGKRKICDLDNNFECSWPLFTETLDEEDIDGVSDSDSDTFSGPS